MKKYKADRRKSPVSHAEYRTFLQRLGDEKKYRDKDYYIAQSSFLTNLISLLPCVIYILDYSSGKYLFMSESCKRILGHDLHEFMTFGQEWAIKELIHPDDLRTISENAFPFFLEKVRNMSIPDLKSSRFSITYRLKRKTNEYFQALQQYVVLEHDDVGNPLLTLGVISDISNHKTDTHILFAITKYDETNGFSTVVKDSYPASKMEVSRREKEIIYLLVQGLSSKEIADRLNISPFTVKVHRQNLLAKSGCKNTVELVNHAIVNGMV